MSQLNLKSNKKLTGKNYINDYFNILKNNFKNKQRVKLTITSLDCQVTKKYLLSQFKSLILIFTLKNNIGLFCFKADYSLLLFLILTLLYSRYSSPKSYPPE